MWFCEVRKSRISHGNVKITNIQSDDSDINIFPSTTIFREQRFMFLIRSLLRKKFLFSSLSLKLNVYVRICVVYFFTNFPYLCTSKNIHLFKCAFMN